MNGEVRATVWFSDGEPVDEWLLLSDDCGVRVTGSGEEIRVLSPPGACRFRVALDEGEDSPGSGWVEAEVLPNESISLDFEILPVDPSPDMEEDTGL